MTDAVAYHPGLTYHDRAIWPWVLRSLYECSRDGTRFSVTAFTRRHKLARSFFYSALDRYEAANLLEVLRDARGWIVDVQRTRRACSDYGERAAAEASGAVPWEGRKPRAKGPPKTPVKAPSGKGALTGVLLFDPDLKAPSGEGALSCKAPSGEGALGGSHPISLQTFEEDNVTLRGGAPEEEPETPENDPPRSAPPSPPVNAPPPPEPEPPEDPDPWGLADKTDEQLVALTAHHGKPGREAKFEQMRRRAIADEAAVAAEPAPAPEVKTPVPVPVVASAAKPAAFVPPSPEDAIRRLASVQPDQAAAVENAARALAESFDDYGSMGCYRKLCREVQNRELPVKEMIGAWRASKRPGARDPARVFTGRLYEYREIKKGAGPRLKFSSSPGSGRSNPNPQSSRPGASP